MEEEVEVAVVAVAMEEIDQLVNYATSTVMMLTTSGIVLIKTSIHLLHNQVKTLKLLMHNLVCLLQLNNNNMNQ